MTTNAAQPLSAAIHSFTLPQPNSDVLRLNALLKEKLLGWMPEPGHYEVGVQGLMMSRRNDSALAENCFYRPTVGIILQGFKHSAMGSEEYHYGENHSMVAAVDMPSLTQIIRATPEQPFVGISLPLDRYLVTQLAGELPPPPCREAKGEFPLRQ